MANNLNISVIDNAQFQAFTRFATSVADKGTALKAEVDLKMEDGTPRKIVAKGYDGWGKIVRNQNSKNINNDIRSLFKATVLGMFGVDDFEALPEKVRTAMKTDDYGTAERPSGKPLTARRILKVSRAIMEATQPVAKQVSLKQARGLVDTAVSWMNDLSPKMTGMQRFDQLRLDDAMRDKAARLVVKYGAGLTAANLGVLAGYAAVAVEAVRFGNYYDESADEIVRRIAETLKPVRNFKPGDIRLAAYDAKMTKYWQAVLKEQLGPAQKRHYDADSLFDTFHDDADRNEYKIGDEVFPAGAEKSDRLKQTFKTRIANPLHRKALSAFLTQMTGGAATSISGRAPLPAAPGYKNLKMTSTKGNELFLTVDKKDEFFQQRILQANSEAKYELKLSDDGTKATITIRASAKLHFNIDGAMQFSMVPAGTCEQQTEFDFDLSDPNKVELTAVRHGQTIVPPTEPPAPQEEPNEDRTLRIDA